MDLEKWAGLGSTLASLMFIYSVVTRFFPIHYIEAYLTRHMQKLIGGLYPYVQITIPEYSSAHMKRNEAFTAIESYLSSSCSRQASKLKADFGNDSSILVLSLDDHEEVVDDFLGVKLWWSSFSVTPPPSTTLYSAPEARRYYKLTFHKSKRDGVIAEYMKHVMKKGREISMHNRQRKLYTNKGSGSWYGYESSFWNHVVLEHPASFDTVAMEPRKKKEILNDLDMFQRGKEYYAKIGKAWKRGYLLYGPPGTGKSTLVAAIANYMEYDIYDLELTTVTTNTELRRMLIETSSKSIILIEDIDCSLELTGKRKNKNKENEEKMNMNAEAADDDSKVTLSGLLNFIDGLWSVSAGERLIVFTTNHIEKLDPALIRRGRMDKHIEMSYCSFEAFKILAKNYLEVESHRLFERIQELMQEVDITPADVAENLMPTSLDDDAETCLERLVQALNKAKEESLKSSSGDEMEDKDDEPINLDDSK